MNKIFRKISSDFSLPLGHRTGLHFTNLWHCSRFLLFPVVNDPREIFISCMILICDTLRYFTECFWLFSCLSCTLLAGTVSSNISDKNLFYLLVIPSDLTFKPEVRPLQVALSSCCPTNQTVGILQTAEEKDQAPVTQRVTQLRTGR
jgi:hypothetical protein